VTSWGGHGATASGPPAIPEAGDPKRQGSLGQVNGRGDGADDASPAVLQHTTHPASTVQGQAGGPLHGERRHTARGLSGLAARALDRPWVAAAPDSRSPGLPTRHDAECDASTARVSGVASGGIIGRGADLTRGRARTAPHRRAAGPVGCPHRRSSDHCDRRAFEEATRITSPDGLACHRNPVPLMGTQDLSVSSRRRAVDRECCRGPRRIFHQRLLKVANQDRFRRSVCAYRRPARLYPSGSASGMAAAVVCRPDRLNPATPRAALPGGRPAILRRAELAEESRRC
jgi:hypothetical protein